MTFKLNRPSRRDFLQLVMGGSTLVHNARAFSGVRASAAGSFPNAKRELLGYLRPRIPSWDDPVLLLVGIGHQGILAVERIRVAHKNKNRIGVAFIHAIDDPEEVTCNTKPRIIQPFRSLLGNVQQVCLLWGLQDGRGVQRRASEAARIARTSGTHVVAIVESAPTDCGCMDTTPYNDALSDWQAEPDATLIVPGKNGYFPETSEKLREATGAPIDWSLEAVQGLTCNWMCLGTISFLLDLADARRIYSGGQLVRMGMGVARGPHRAEQAVGEALAGSCLDGSPMKEAHAVWATIFGLASPEEISRIAHGLRSAAHWLAPVCFGNPLCQRTFDLGEWLQVTIHAAVIDLDDDLSSQRNNQDETETRRVE
jgi:cell division GTPase FtsZ